MFQCNVYAGVLLKAFEKWCFSHNSRRGFHFLQVLRRPCRDHAVSLLRLFSCIAGEENPYRQTLKSFSMGFNAIVKWQQLWNWQAYMVFCTTELKQVKNTVYCLFVDNTDLKYQPIGSEYQCKIKYSIVSPDSIFFCFFLEK